MTTTLLLIRHGSHGRLGKVLCGRIPGVTLSAEGRAEAQRTAVRLAEGTRIDAILSSPLERARETAAPLSAATGTRVEIDQDLDEIDFGAWAGQSFADLELDPLWAAWNRNRDHARPPGGERMAEAQSRIVRCIEHRCAEPGDRTLALVGHADMIKAALAWGLGLPLAFVGRFEISPASVSRIAVGPDHVMILSVNER